MFNSHRSTKRFKIAIFTAPQGHLSLAQAASEAFPTDQFQTQIFLHRDAWFDLYLPIYQFLPAGLNVAFTLSQQKSFLAVAKLYFAKQYEKWLHSQLQKFKPDLVITTFYMFVPYLANLAQQQGLKVINVISDPWTIHPLAIAPPPIINVGFDDQTAQVAQTAGPKISYQSIGWLVQNKFEAAYQLEKAKKALKLDPAKLTILVASGSDGTNLVMKLLPALIFNQTPIQVLVACGHNQQLQKMVNRFSFLARQLQPANQLQTIGFTTDLHRYFQAADLVVGKAGPNTVFETVSTQTPFLAITHISGQETGNLELIKKYQLGLVEENSLKLSQLITQLINQPQLLTKFQPSLAKLAKTNAGAKTKLLAIAEKMLANREK